MNQLLAIAIGGSVGALARFWVANGLYEWLGRSFPHGTLFVNITGSFFMGLLTALTLMRFPLSVEFRSFVLVGFLGAYTTFSTFAFETLALLEEGELLKGLLNVFLSVVLCLAAVWFGMVIGRRWFAGEALPWAMSGFPLGLFILGLLLAILAGAGMETLFQRLNWTLQWQTVSLLGLLGLWVTLSSMGLSWQLSALAIGPREWISLFAGNALATTAAVWFGMQLSRVF